MKIIKDKGFKIYNHKLSTLTTTIMKQMNCNGIACYVAPEVLCTEISVEQGFAQTGLDWHEGGAGDYDGYTNDNGTY